jgi:catechol 2,3-dioxygenase-like lactoylglutathione lyase family enzyme
MAKIRHIALCAEDPARLAEFYKTTFGLQEIARMPGDGPRGIFLSDGYINLAIIPARGEKEGINHFGFQVEDVRETGRRAKEAGASTGIAPRPQDGRYVEVRLHDPVGTPVDLAEAGWATRPEEGLRPVAEVAPG